MKRNKEQNYLMRDLGIVALSIILALALVKTRALDGILSAAQEATIIGSFLAGMFYISVFTVAPAIVVLSELISSLPIWEVALFGGLGAALGDLLIFRFVKNNLMEALILWLRRHKEKKVLTLFRSRWFDYILFAAGALIVLSPLPDELGLALMGVSQIRNVLFFPVSFALNFFSILILGLAARSLF
ncbi:hypothetical protein A3G56_03470 [Candidatus Falkowbacteria bacterium RIFCSPLOWO2_12_FULL_45_10]|uniref:TVP38/TMEM64 family membrane protein n=3 Tax=Candidatus Falkowiibacteriota TaxID=1752728 RepID=A0A1F5RMH5_9BACT|nr:MAG: hypothetical protein A3D54_00315 [Candidatus Falkowbacteria bacterium RIFCSPHIGHO2_02_FULL_45_15]OGF18537.1 MAG: hypothetical protein A3G56_03470 [Candidatus Falkowbacteria bacterium RIFCSPLOWO2_12_FULL_45_10]OGF19960.1 MAG: hypothetical protein A3I35_04155 [Candidatus Falkowbacteria bacterium RIFCSPLOWO2_02_FULL_45_15]